MLKNFKLIYNLIRFEIENFLHPDLIFSLNNQDNLYLKIFNVESKCRYRKKSLMLLGTRFDKEFIKHDIVFYSENDLTFLN